CSFALVVTLLYGCIDLLIRQRQEIALENEQLKTENLSTRYNMLVSQINPHFFFNSLNSLAMLVRERDAEKALTYIDQLSYTFRYIIQNGQNTLSTLDEELKFADAYGYLFRIRYADKLFIDVDVEERLRSWRLPALSLQPLIGNAVKHNAITKAHPLHVSIRTEDGWLVVSNPKQPKLDPEPSTGIGLKNLADRSRLITGRSISIENGETIFTVRIPLTEPFDA
ncbi:MAG: histidine kinase, partial [Alistipes sp.]|nr:histidine kinase [Alistipes sp.]